MAIISPDFSEAVEFTPIQPGVYNTRIMACETKTSQKGDTYLKWTLQIFGAEGAAAKFNNLNVYTNTMLKGPGAGRLKELLVAAIGEARTQLDTDILIGKEVKAVLVEGKRQDGSVSQYPEVKTIKPLH